MAWATALMRIVLLAWEMTLAFQPLRLSETDWKSTFLEAGWQKGKPRCLTLWSHSLNRRLLRAWYEDEYAHWNGLKTYLYWEAN